MQVSKRQKDGNGKAIIVACPYLNHKRNLQNSTTIKWGRRCAIKFSCRRFDNKSVEATPTDFPISIDAQILKMGR